MSGSLGAAAGAAPASRRPAAAPRKGAPSRPGPGAAAWASWRPSGGRQALTALAYREQSGYALERSAWQLQSPSRAGRAPSGRSPTSQSDNRQFFLSMQSAQSPSDALRLLAAYEQQLQARHVAGMLVHIASLLRQAGEDEGEDHELLSYSVDYASATLHPGEWGPVAAQLSRWVHQHVDRLFYQHLASIAWAWAKMGWLLQPEEAQRLAEQVQQQRLDPSIAGGPAAPRRAAAGAPAPAGQPGRRPGCRPAPQPAPCGSHLLRPGLPCAGNARHVAKLAWGCSRLGLRQPELWRHLGALAVQVGPLLNARELANIHWSLAHAGAQQPEALAGLQRHLLRQLPSCNGQDLANTAWALAVLRQPQPALLQALGDAAAALPLRSLGRPQHISNLAWAFGKLRFQHPQMMAALCSAAARAGRSFSSQQLANLLWGMATLKHRDPQLLAALLQVRCCWRGWTARWAGRRTAPRCRGRC
jgi:hypothetical protein